MWWGWFDPIYFAILAPGVLLALWAQLRIRSIYQEATHVPARSGVTGAEVADLVLHRAAVVDVEIEPVMGFFFSDHYVPGRRVLRLSPDVYAGRSLAALGRAAHESGHAIQDQRHYPLLRLHNALVPAASIGSGLAWVVLAVGFALSSLALIELGVIVFAATVLFQLVVNLPVELDASRRARLALVQGGLVTREEDRTVRRVLSAAAWTSVAATLTSLLALLSFLLLAGTLGGRWDD
jgi:Zn-dependent membrane protease YugP